MCASILAKMNNNTILVYNVQDHRMYFESGTIQKTCWKPKMKLRIQSDISYRKSNMNTDGVPHNSDGYEASLNSCIQ